MKISNLGRKSLVQRQDSHTQEDGVNIKVIRMEATGESDSLVASSGNMSSTNIIVDPQASEIVTIPDHAGIRHSLEVPSSNMLPANIIVGPQSFEVVTIPGRAGMSAYDIWLDEGNEGTKEEFLNGLAKSVLSYKGTADTFADLPTTGNAVGDFWNIRDTGFNFVWDGEGWDQVSGLTDLSNYVDITTFESQLTQLQTDVDARDSELEDIIYDTFDEIYRIDDELAQLDARDSELEDDIYDAMDLLFSFEEDVEQLDFYINDLYFYMEDLYDIKQDKLVAGYNITIDPITNVISASDEMGLDEMSYFDYAGVIYGDKYDLLPSAWEHSLTVDTATRAQYPKGGTEGVIIPHGITSIGEQAFYNWSLNNRPLVIPNSVTRIEDNAFESWKANNQPLVIPNNVTIIGAYAFSEWSSNTYPLVIPGSVTAIGVHAFRHWGLVPYVEMKGATPPALITSGVFDSQNEAPIYVPDESVAAYKTAINWEFIANRIFPVSQKDDSKNTIIDGGAL